jgi:hypothetical protein
MARRTFSIKIIAFICLFLPYVTSKGSGVLYGNDRVPDYALEILHKEWVKSDADEEGKTVVGVKDKNESI